MLKSRVAFLSMITVCVVQYRKCEAFEGRLSNPPRAETNGSWVHYVCIMFVFSPTLTFCYLNNNNIRPTRGSGEFGSRPAGLKHIDRYLPYNLFWSFTTISWKIRWHLVLASGTVMCITPTLLPRHSSSLPDHWAKPISLINSHKSNESHVTL